MRGSLWLLFTITMNLFAIAVGFGVVGRHQDYSDLTVGLLLFFVGLTASSIQFRAYRGGARTPSSVFLTIVTHFLAAALLMVGIGVCILTPTRPGLRLGAGLSLFAVVNIAAVWWISRILRAAAVHCAASATSETAPPQRGSSSAEN